MNTADIPGEASESLAEGDAALASEQFTEAIMAFRAGLRILGDHYRGDRLTLDSTPTRITLAGLEERKGNTSAAAHLLRNALETRIFLMRRKLSEMPGGAPAEGVL